MSESSGARAIDRPSGRRRSDRIVGASRATREGTTFGTPSLVTRLAVGRAPGCASALAWILMAPYPRR